VKTKGKRNPSQTQTDREPARKTVARVHVMGSSAALGKQNAFCFEKGHEVLFPMAMEAGEPETAEEFHGLWIEHTEMHREEKKTELF
jgi:hypothetical protein